MGHALLQSLGVILLAIIGALAGVWFGRRTSRWWIVGFIAPLVLILLVGAPRRHYPLSFVPPFSWLVAGRIEFALVAPLACMLMATPISRLKERRTRWLAGAFVAVFVMQASVLPFLMPAIQRDALSKLETRVGRDGVCKQSTDYTCGPAASVTALRAVGINATEAELALLASTSRSTGTEPDVLAAALEERFRADGLKCEYCPFTSASELPRDRPTIVLINYKFLIDHYIAVLGTDDAGNYIVGDPLEGRRSTMTGEQLEAVWRRVGIVLSRER